MKKRLFIYISLCFISVNMYATIVNRGTCGDSIEWTLSDDNILNIFGSGVMYDYSSYLVSPFYELRNDSWRDIKIVINPGIEHIGDYSFAHLYNASSVEIPNTVKSIGHLAFEDCFWHTETSVFIPASVVSIDDNPFTRCKKLQSFKVDKDNPNFRSKNGVLFDQSLSTIVAYPSGKEGEYVIPNHTRTIGVSAFKYANLTKVTIPYSVREIQIGAFSGCQSLSEVITYQTSPLSIDGVFLEKDLKNMKLFVPAQSLQLFQNSNIWKKFGEIIPLNILITSVDIDSSCYVMNVGDKNQIAVNIQPEYATNKELVWEVDNNNIVSVDDGLVTAFSIGKTIVTARANDGSGVFATCSVIVDSVAVNSIDLLPSSANINVGQYITLLATITPSNASNQQLSWHSSNIDIASVTNGVVVGRRPGTVIITARSTDGSNIDATATIKVSDIKASNIDLNRSSVSMFVGDKEILVANISPKNVTNNDIRWFTTNSNVATVKDGVVTAIGYGNATITATTADGTDLCAMCQILVDKRNQSIRWNQSINNVVYGGQLTELTAESSSGLKIKYKSNDENIVNIFDLGDVVYLNPGNCGKTSIIAYQEGNYEYYPSEEYQKEVEVVNTTSNSSKVLVAYYSQSSLINGIVAELANQIACSNVSVNTQKIEPTNNRINNANTNSEVRDSVMNIISFYPNESSSYPEIKTINVNINDYDNIIMVYPLWNALMAAPMQTFNFYYKDILEKKSNAYIEYDLFGEVGPSSNAKALRLSMVNIDNKEELIKEWLNQTDATGTTSIKCDQNRFQNGFFDLQGRELQKAPQKGIYIENGFIRIK